jgi:hypothetical protein
MKEGLDFSLPDAPRKRGVRAIELVLLAAVTATLALVILDRRSGRVIESTDSPNTVDVATADALRRAAEDLERRTLYREAADAWHEYREEAELAGIELSDALFREGRNLVEAGEYGRAALVLTQSESLALSDDKRRQARGLIAECLSGLGKEDAREFLVRASTSTDAKEAEASPVVASIGSDRITVEDIRDRLALDVRAMLRAQHPDWSTIEHDARANEIAREQMKNRKVLDQLLATTIQTEVLYRKALESGHGADRETKRVVESFRRAYLAERTILARMQDVLSAITPVDLRNHYDADPEKWAEKPRVDFAFRRFPTEAAARAGLANPDAASFEKGQSPAVQGEEIQGIGRSSEATAHLLALDVGAMGDRPIEIAGAWYIFRADAKHPRRPRTFEEALDDVRADLIRVKQREAVARLEAELRLQYLVHVDEEALGRIAVPEPVGDGAEPPGTKPASSSDPAPTK